MSGTRTIETSIESHRVKHKVFAEEFYRLVATGFHTLPDLGFPLGAFFVEGPEVFVDAIFLIDKMARKILSHIKMAPKLK